MKNKSFKVECPDCHHKVDRVDGEYARHYYNDGILCSMSKREIVETREEKKGP